MPRYKYYSYQQTAITAIDLEKQILSGTLEDAIYKLVEERVKIDAFEWYTAKNWEMEMKMRFLIEYSFPTAGILCGYIGRIINRSWLNMWLKSHIKVCISEWFKNKECTLAETTAFEWDEDKNKLNQKKHNISFEEAQYAFSDSKRIIAKDLEPSESEERYYCFGKIGENILTVRFTYRNTLLTEKRIKRSYVRK